jgi:hypothetical protein
LRHSAQKVGWRGLRLTACFRDQNGRQRRIATKETNNKKALKLARYDGYYAFSHSLGY